MSGNNKMQMVHQHMDKLKKKMIKAIPRESPSSQNSSPAAWLLSSRAIIKPIGFRRLEEV